MAQNNVLILLLIYDKCSINGCWILQFKISHWQWCERFVIVFEYTGLGVSSKHLLHMYPHKSFYLNVLPHAFWVYKAHRQIYAFVHSFSLRKKLSLLGYLRRILPLETHPVFWWNIIEFGKVIIFLCYHYLQKISRSMWSTSDFMFCKWSHLFPHSFGWDLFTLILPLILSDHNW